jgi:hypothetical protein
MTEGNIVNETNGATEETLTASQSTVPREELVRLRAYQLFIQRNGDRGDAESDWYRAEVEIASKDKHDHSIKSA